MRGRNGSETLSRKAGYEFVHIAAHKVNEDFPDSAEKLAEYSAVLISDVGKNTFLLPPESFFQFKRTPNKLTTIKEYVEAGGGLGMIGGYMTFMGIGGRAAYKNTVIETILPVVLMTGDDRVEIPEGAVPTVPSGEDFWSGIPSEWPFLLGYNRVEAKPGARVLLRNGDDPLIVLGEYGQGRTLAFATDCAPHWAPAAFCEWEHYGTMWKKLLVWLTRE